MNEFRRDISLYALVAANFLPAVGVFFFGWQAGNALLFYWSENLVIGFYAILRMALAPGGLLAKAGLIPFFVVHFGMFTLVHGMFVVLLVQWYSGGLPADSGFPGNPLATAISTMPWALAFLYVSHGISFFLNFVFGQERYGTTVRREMERPYRRITVMHFTILASFFLMGLSGWAGSASSAGRLTAPLVLVAIKTAVDIRYHLDSHLLPIRPGWLGGLFSLLARR